MKKTLRQRLQNAAYLYTSHYLLRKTPVVIYTHGRVGSMALLSDLRRAGIFALKAEFRDHQGDYSTRFVYQNIFPHSPRVPLIVLVRDPVDVMCSYYFSKVTRDWIPGGKAAFDRGDVAALQSLFISECLRTDRLLDHLEWFEREFTPTTGIHIFTHPLDPAVGHMRIAHDHFPTLVLRTDIAPAQKQAALEDFLRPATPITTTTGNSRAKKTGADLYTSFKQSLMLPTDLTEQIYSSSYATHFFTAAERAERIARLTS